MLRKLVKSKKKSKVKIKLRWTAEQVFDAGTGTTQWYKDKALEPHVKLFLVAASAEFVIWSLMKMEKAKKCDGNQRKKLLS